MKLTLHHSHTYANVDLRLVAWLIDMLLLNLPTLFAVYVLVSQPNITDAITNIFYLIAFIFFPMIFIQFVYHFYSIATWGKTVGKAMVGIEVADDKGHLLTKTQAFMRENVTKGVSAVLLGAGFWAAAFTKDHRAWHDEFAGSYVYKKNPRLGLGIMAVVGLLALYVFASIWLWQMAVASPMMAEIKTYLSLYSS